MRVKTEDRRQAIIEVAVQVFRDVGFERASMDVISRRLGGSKGTLYGYFQSKEQLFEAAMTAAVTGPGDQIMNCLDPDRLDVRKTLEDFGVAYLKFVTGEQVLAITRTAVSEGATASLGPHLFEQGPRRALIRLEGFFAELMGSKRLRQAPTPVAAIHFKGLIEAGFLEEALYDAPLAQQIDEAVPLAVDVFLRAYGGELLQSDRPALLPGSGVPGPSPPSERSNAAKRRMVRPQMSRGSRDHG